MTPHEQKAQECAERIASFCRDFITSDLGIPRTKHIADLIVKYFPEPGEKVCECKRLERLFNPLYCDHCGGKIV